MKPEHLSRKELNKMLKETPGKWEVVEKWDWCNRLESDEETLFVFYDHQRNYGAVRIPK